jgi:hypothetical protein
LTFGLKRLSFGVALVAAALSGCVSKITDFPVEPLPKLTGSQLPVEGLPLALANRTATSDGWRWTYRLSEDKTTFYGFQYAGPQAGWTLREVVRWSRYFKKYCTLDFSFNPQGMAFCYDAKPDSLVAVPASSWGSDIKAYAVAGDRMRYSRFDAKTGQLSHQLDFTLAPSAEEQLSRAQWDFARQMEIEFEERISEGERNDRSIAKFHAAKRSEDKFWKGLENVNTAMSGVNAGLAAGIDASRPPVTAPPAPVPTASMSPSTPGAKSVPGKPSGATPTSSGRAGTSTTAAPSSATGMPTTTASSQRVSSTSYTTKNSSTVDRSSDARTASASKGSAGAASTDDDPSRCVSPPVLGSNPNCKAGNSARIENNCPQSVDARICIKTTDGKWDCGVSWGINPGKSWSWPSCRGTSEVFFDVRSTGGKRQLRNPT